MCEGGARRSCFAVKKIVTFTAFTATGNGVCLVLVYALAPKQEAIGGNRFVDVDENDDDDGEDDERSPDRLRGRFRVEFRGTSDWSGIRLSDPSLRCVYTLSIGANEPESDFREREMSVERRR